MSIYIDDAYGKQSQAYANLAAIVILVFDYCITVENEAAWVWGRKWDIGRVTFMFARYSPFPAVALTVSSAMKAAAFEWCSDWYQVGQASNPLHMISIIAAEGLLLLRVWVFWDCSRPLLVLLLVMAIVSLSSTSIFALYIQIKTAKSFVIAALIAPKVIHFEGEYVRGIDPCPTKGPWACNFTLTVKSDSFQSDSQLIRSLYRDSLLYVTIMILITIGNIVNMVTAPRYFNEYADRYFLSRTHGG
ncbi:hypothetical protein CONPUDRAFT_68768 [Coniophora puteana RWD-64-598 SS2]|uniref:DUF6533 domain-containing protein n=1 Tax=Coniophora puteana (strain RWD-64-598) TaxID=741705 RepID=A0A5M3N5N4_CONPW|nr:uncharacterized protein CONPUDRAFT_68768 [Coniophora puteana RWD-64-598 SS2]EIW86175.1 hypothetical protein CONPUDRAFT_68768 [Coniophora puteana RWD-64-598 SS2]